MHFIPFLMFYTTKYYRNAIKSNQLQKISLLQKIKYLYKIIKKYVRFKKSLIFIDNITLIILTNSRPLNFILY